MSPERLEDAGKLLLRVLEVSRALDKGLRFLETHLPRR
jgi:hypothetical protein